jgi:hypothetical protein
VPAAAESEEAGESHGGGGAPSARPRAYDEEMPGDWRRLAIRGQLGESLAGQERYAEAGPLPLGGCGGMRARCKNVTAAAARSMPGRRYGSPRVRVFDAEDALSQGAPPIGRGYLLACPAVNLSRDHPSHRARQSRDLSDGPPRRAVSDDPGGPRR